MWVVWILIIIGGFSLISNVGRKIISHVSSSKEEKAINEIVDYIESESLVLISSHDNKKTMSKGLIDNAIFNHTEIGKKIIEFIPSLKKSLPYSYFVSIDEVYSNLFVVQRDLKNKLNYYIREYNNSFGFSFGDIEFSDRRSREDREIFQIKHKLKKIDKEINRLDKIDKVLDSLHNNVVIINLDDKELMKKYANLSEKNEKFVKVNSSTVIVKDDSDDSSVSDSFIVLSNKLEKLRNDKKSYLGSLKNKDNADQEVLGIFDYQIEKFTKEVNEVEDRVRKDFCNVVEDNYVAEVERFDSLDNELTLTTMHNLLKNDSLNS